MLSWNEVLCLSKSEVQRGAQCCGCLPTMLRFLDPSLHVYTNPVARFAYFFLPPAFTADQRTRLQGWVIIGWNKQVEPAESSSLLPAAQHQAVLSRKESWRVCHHHPTWIIYRPRSEEHTSVLPGWGLGNVADTCVLPGWVDRVVVGIVAPTPAV